jgi:two-component system, cell cycle sensor histidine kinase and response regulator CckA
MASLLSEDGLTMLMALLWLAIGVCVASGLTHLAVWRSRGRGHAHRLFGILCLILAGLLFFDTRCYSAPSAESYLAAMRIVMAQLFAFWLALAWFCHAYTGFGRRRFFYALTLVYAVLLIANLVMPFTAFYAGPVVLRPVPLPWGDRFVIAKGPIAWTAATSFLLSLGILTWALSAAVRQHRAGRRPEGRALGVGLLAILLGVVSDGVVDTLMVDWFYLTEFGFVAMALVMNGRLAGDWALRQHEAQRAEARLRSILEAAQDVAFVVVDLTGNHERIREFSPGAERLFGHTRAQALGGPVALLFPTEEAAHFSGVLRRIAAGLPGYSGEAMLVRESGEPFPALYTTYPLPEADSRTGGALLVAIDLSALRRAEAALKRSEADLRRAQAVARIGSWHYEAQSHTVEWSDEMYRILDMDPGKAIDRETFVERVHPEDRERVIAATRAVFAGQSLDLRCRVLAGSRERWVHVLAQGEVDSDGRVVAILGTTRDVSDEVKLETQLFQAQKMEAVGQLAGGVAHDFNNLLQVISGNAELALISLDPKHAAHDLVAEIRKAGNKAVTLVRQLLAFSRRQVLKLANLDLNDVLGGMMKILARAIGEHVRIDFAPGHGLGGVRADRGQIEVVLMNLCVNARDAMQDGGVLTLTTENVEIGEEFTGSRPWARSGSYVRLRVVDTGCGMDAVTAAHVFEPFFTTKGIGQGTGLGLATVFGVVKQHNGMIDLRSAPGQGTTVDVYLPRVEPSQPAGEASAAQRPAGGTETVLVVEDHPDVRTLLQRVLTRAGYAVRTAQDGSEALALPEEETAQVGLAILDVVLPGRGGRAVYEALRARHPKMRFVFLSGFSPDSSQIRDAVDRGVEFVQKPIAPNELLRTVRRILDAPE